MSDQIDAALRKALVRRQEDALELESRLEEADRAIDALRAEVERLYSAISVIAYHEPQHDEVAENMRQVARAALWTPRS